MIYGQRITHNAPQRESEVCIDPHHCITCSDEGVPMRVLSVNAEWGSALCVPATDDQEPPDRDAPAVQQEILTGLVDNVQPGDVLLVHAGTALARLAFNPILP